MLKSIRTLCVTGIQGPICSFYSRATLGESNTHFFDPAYIGRDYRESWQAVHKLKMLFDLADSAAA